MNQLMLLLLGIVVVLIVIIIVITIKEGSPINFFKGLASCMPAGGTCKDMEGGECPDGYDPNPIAGKFCPPGQLCCRKEE
jgi:hypothetical protein